YANGVAALDKFRPQDDLREGGGIGLHAVDTATLVGVNSLSNAVGLSAYNSLSVTVQSSDFSDCTAWGIHLNSTKYSTINSSKLNRVYQPVYDPPSPPTAGGGLDAAGILAMMNSDHTVFTNNQMIGGAEGYFFSADGDSALAQSNKYTFVGYNAFNDNIA